MSLTMQIKNELVRQDNPLSCCSSWELKALLLRRGYYTIGSGSHIMSIAVEDNAVARRLFNLLREAGIEAPLIIRQQERRLGLNRFLVQVPGKEQIDALLIYLDLKEAGRQIGFYRRKTALPRRACCRRAFLRGLFLAGGSISVSKRSGYHLELNCGSSEDADIYCRVLKSFNLSPLARKRKNDFFIYFKNAEAVADFLRIIGAGGTLLQLESRRVLKNMRNQVNRLVNCETANLEKVVASAQHQLEIIEHIDRLIGLENLPHPLREAALVRRSHPEASLKELGELCNPPISKSAVNNRFRRLEIMAQKAAASTSSKKHASR
ncbi:MAG TPA: DNA-binding protein WhiA [Firmicutes bacterium]|nr:DNA-binding protein WhiA [Bacillota bacterium]